MAQNAYHYQNLATTLPDQPTPVTKKVRTKRKYQPAVWTKNERGLAVFMATVVIFLMLFTVGTTVAMQRVDAQNQTITQKITKVKEENDSYRGDIQAKTNPDNLEKVAKSANMEQSADNVRNVNQ
ncbi:septum formation initiator family protein [Fructobacillus ficulneus]|uniref:Cell division protein FtsL n=1 Tax=Fructobacillus ficulneus TaxID=157463 RepID=A0A0K8MHP7_9LACO|nr:septum formation initiator family protein [Fructobacillus ficulneus]GAP00087.1 cell division protein FtsL [Fructobacillus ficulneus]